ncbi:hypothetical protein [Gracilinema caldarium]|uniref:hypothetical protein n=1 Tax=Gracilinema caldarium TaxID=215591 RepID=UPI0026F2D526|nr:hypothetical protein [Gracilinema caldarium]
MMDCVQVATLLNSWEQKESITTAELEALKAHLAECSSCSRQYGALIPLLDRDGGLNTQVKIPLESTKVPDTERLMAGLERAIAADKQDFHSQIQSRRFKRFIPWAAVAALLVLLPLGYLLYANRNSDVVTVRFFLEAPGATTVMVSGNFNQWSSMDIPLKPEGDGKTWSATVRLKRSREYRYNFVIDNQIWIADPHAAVSIDDDFGGKVSLLDL